MTLDQIADLLDGAPRYGHAPETDRGPGGRFGASSVAAESGASEGTDRYVKLSDAIARNIAQSLRLLARGESPRALELERR